MVTRRGSYFFGQPAAGFFFAKDLATASSQLPSSDRLD